MNSDTSVKYKKPPKTDFEKFALANQIKTHAGTIAVTTKATPMNMAANSSDWPEATKAVEHSYI